MEVSLEKSGTTEYKDSKLYLEFLSQPHEKPRLVHNFLATQYMGHEKPKPQHPEGRSLMQYKSFPLP